MKPLRRSILHAFPLALLLVAGCASYSGWGLRPGLSTGTEVRRVMGEPAKICTLPGDMQNWIYPQGPMGMHTYNARIDRDGVLRGFENVLEDAGFAKVIKGTTTKGEVLCMFGPPLQEVYFQARHEMVWDYRFRDVWRYPARFHVLFDDAGVVTGTMQIREERDGFAR